ncbi:MAG: hypothetical protein KGY60_13155 [Bacteroidales bacterium]|nr:hypothetical protein [Bacteroidales bacterium]
MRHTKSIFTSILMIVLFSISAMAQSEAEVIGVINKADWCPVCEKNGARAMKALKGANQDGAIKFIGNDLTDDDTKKKSAMRLKKHGLYEKMKSKNGTGIVFFFDVETKELVDRISVAKSDQKLAAAVRSAKKE